MIGAILGDIIGGPYECSCGGNPMDFPLFSASSRISDDSVMTLAVADGLMNTPPDASDDMRRTCLICALRKWGRRYPNAGYGARFYTWLHSDDPQPYGSYGNGSAMRVSAAAWLFDSLDSVRKAARLSAEITHNHPEGIRGAEATATAIYLARTGRSKAAIRQYITDTFGYDLSRTCDEIRRIYRHDSSCQGTVPEAITAFLTGSCFEDVIRTAVSLGGDCDTLTAIAGSIAEGFYGVPPALVAECAHRLPPDLLEILRRFRAHIGTE